jgi:pimeloyl-ACP methyl ester carboxylesterase
MLVLAGGCARLPPVERAALKPETPAALRSYLLEHEPDVEVFRPRGPFSVTAQRREIRVSARERIESDLFLSGADGIVPLVIFVHGHESSKAAHSAQAVHLASWGLHCLAVQLPPKGPWDSNGRTLARIVSLISRTPEVLERRIDVERVILVGYSFGATAVGVALAEGAPAAGAILLDPAAIGKAVPDLLRRIEKPVLILGSDDEVYATRDREHFFDFIRGDVAELSIRDTEHEDAEYPAGDGGQGAAGDGDDRQEYRMAFVTALTSGAISLSATGRFDYAWESFAPAFSSGKFFNAKKK